MRLSSQLNPFCTPHIRLAAGWLLFATALSFAGCADIDTSASQTIWYQPLERQRPRPRPVDPVAPAASEQEQRNFEEVFAGVEAAPVRLFERPNIEQWANEIESIYLRAGRYLELVGIYQHVVDELGLTSRAAPRLAWAYVRLGQRHLAGPFLQRLEQAQPDDAAVHFVRGAYWFNDARDSQTAAARAVLAWRKTLELDPDFSGFGPFESQSLSRQLDRLESRLDRPAADIIDEANTPSDAQSGSP